MVVRDQVEGAKRAIESAKDLVNRIYIADQGSRPDAAAYYKGAADLYLRCTRKDLADIDRQWLYDLVQEDWVLSLDTDEYLSEKLRGIIPKIVEQPYDIFWFPFKNLVDGVDIREILGDDPHPRLWRKGKLRWPPQAHTFPQAAPDAQAYFCAQPYVIVHDRDLETLRKTQAERGQVIAPDKRQMQDQFLQRVEALLKRGT